MKKLLLVLAAWLLAFGVWEASADFADGDLVRVVYQVLPGGTYELATDLGSAASIMSGGALNSNTFNLWSSGYFSGSNPGTLEVAYFATNGAETTLWTSGPQGVQESSVGSQGQYAMDEILNAYWAYANEATLATNAAWYEKANSDSYYYTLDHNWNGKKTNPGTGNFGGFYSTANGEATLVSNASVSQDIFVWTDPAHNHSILGFGSEMFVTTVDGSGNITTTMVPAVAVVPIPPGVLLLGSGLLGLAAIRRKNIFTS